MKQATAKPNNSKILTFRTIRKALASVLEKMHIRVPPSGIYEVLDYAITLELLDIRGQKASINKTQLVRYLQDHIIAYQDQAWGQGEILVNYQCSPGIPADVYMMDNKTIILISLQEERSRGDHDEFNISWGINNGFLHHKESWTTMIRHRTRNLMVRIVFPQFRPPSKVSVIERNTGRTSPLEPQDKTQLPDGRWQLTWRQPSPRLFETYILEWEW